MDKILLYNIDSDLYLEKENQQVVLVFDDAFIQSSFKIILNKRRSKNKILIISNTRCSLHIDVVIQAEECECCVYGLFSSKNKKKIKVNICTMINKDKVMVNKYFLSLLGDQGRIETIGNIFMSPGIKQSSGHLSKENIIFGKNVEVSGLPMLDIHSNNISASHGLKVDKITEDKFFYMFSRGIDRRKSTFIILDSLVNSVLKNISYFSEQEFSSIKKSFMDELL